MKTLKQTVIALSLVLVYGSASAFKAPNYQQGMPVAVNTYIDAVAYGKTDKLEEIIDNRAIFTFNSANGTKTYDKKSVLAMITATRGVQQNCDTSFKVLETGDKHAQIKVFYKYENFIRIDNLTMADTRNGWKITKVSSSFI